MSRKHRAQQRTVLPDPRFDDIVVTKFINNMMIGGKKSIAEKIFYGALEKAAEKGGEEGIKLFRKAMSNVKPSVEVKSRRIGGATFQIPTEIRGKRKISIGMKWLIKFSRERSGKGMAEKLAAELIAASKNEGAAVKRKVDTHKMAESSSAPDSFVLLKLSISEVEVLDLNTQPHSRLRYTLHGQSWSQRAMDLN